MIATKKEYNNLVKEILTELHPGQDKHLRDYYIENIQNNQLIFDVVIKSYFQFICQINDIADEKKILELIREFGTRLFDPTYTLFDDMKKLIFWQKKQNAKYTFVVNKMNEVCKRLGFETDALDILTRTLILCSGGQVSVVKALDVLPLEYTTSYGITVSELMFEAPKGFRILKPNHFQFLFLYQRIDDEMVFMLSKNAINNHTRIANGLYGVDLKNIIYTGKYHNHKIHDSYNHDYWKPLDYNILKGEW